MGHRGACSPLDFQQFSFFYRTLEPEKCEGNLSCQTSSGFSVPRLSELVYFFCFFVEKNEKGISDFFCNTVYIWPLFYVILRVWLTLFRCRFAPLLAPNPGAYREVTTSCCWSNLSFIIFTFLTRSRCGAKWLSISKTGSDRWAIWCESASARHCPSRNICPIPGH